ncbi:MAG: tetratricopeptide repeat protein [bacterium]|jgi:tetratricopeptide (TPR) repeat protein
MKRNWILITTALGVLAASLAGTGCQKLKARDQLNKGVQAFRSANYTAAVEHFKQALEADPTFHNARLYLATAYMNQWIPGADSPENQQMAQGARENFEQVLAEDPNNTVALSSLASMAFHEAGGIQDTDAKLKQLEVAAEWYEKLAKVEPTNKEAWYSLGVIAWSKWYPAIGKARSDLQMKPEDPGPLKDKKVREQLRQEWSETIQTGIEYLEKALSIDPQYDDAMVYLNLLNRERADLAETPEEYRRDIEAADNWLQKALDTRKIKTGALPAEGGAQ